MSELKIHKWKYLKLEGPFNLLLGNGFSIGIHRQFNYPELKKASNLSANSKRLFTNLPELSHEGVLNFLEKADTNQDPIFKAKSDGPSIRISEFKKDLQEVIAKIHPKYGELDYKNLEEKATVLADFNSVFTTNYDLLLPWMIFIWNIEIQKKSKFIDYFWEPIEDDDLPRSPRKNQVPVHYLHGGLHLHRTDAGGAEKINDDGQSYLKTIKDNIGNGRYPLIVAEGTYQQKKIRIGENHYLRFCIDQLKRQSEPFVIFGHNLSEEFDLHIIKALGKAYQNSKDRSIFISVFEKKSDSQALQGKAIRINKLLKKHLPKIKVFFYNARTHPLC